MIHKISLNFTLFLAITLFLVSCGVNTNKSGILEPYGDSNSGKFQLDSSWADYWYAGDAEVNQYYLEQYRYGEKRSATSTMIYVTEPFSKSKQVKLDNPNAAGNDKTTVLKLNFNRKFVTGIYDYSIMQSIFTPVSGDYAKSLKATCSVQDWCGQAFSQINKRDNEFRYRSFSYFESEGDTDVNFEGAALEDELWARLRMAPNSITADRIMLVPSMAFLRLSHIENKPYPARISIQPSGTDTGKATVLIDYEEIDRKVLLHFSTAFPYTIDKWEEIGSFNGREYHNVAVLNKRMKIPYWKHNSVRDSTYREALFE